MSSLGWKQANPDPLEGPCSEGIQEEEGMRGKSSGQSSLGPLPHPDLGLSQTLPAPPKDLSGSSSSGGDSDIKLETYELPSQLPLVFLKPLEELEKNPTSN